MGCRQNLPQRLVTRLGKLKEITRSDSAWLMLRVPGTWPTLLNRICTPLPPPPPTCTRTATSGVVPEAFLWPFRASCSQKPAWRAAICVTFRQQPFPRKSSRRAGRVQQGARSAFNAITLTVTSPVPVESEVHVSKVG